VSGFNDVTAVKKVPGAVCQTPEKSFANVLQAAEKLANDGHVTAAKQRIPKRSIYSSAAGDSMADYYPMNTSIPRLGDLRSNLDSRFGKLQPTHRLYWV
jgi:hypothetical protein